MALDKTNDRNSMDVISRRRYVVASLNCYWKQNPEAILNLPIPIVMEDGSEPIPPLVQKIDLPDWAQDIGVEGQILVPQKYILSGEEPLWERIDWLGTVFWYLNGLAERSFEKKYGCIYSYSFRLKDWNPELWRHAWVNRIALFLRRWAAHCQNIIDEDTFFGPLPQTQIIITHDIDATCKTYNIYLKQTAFFLYGVLVYIYRRQLRKAWGKLCAATRFIFTQSEWKIFDTLFEIESLYNIKSWFFVYSSTPGSCFYRDWIIDPSYHLSDTEISRSLYNLHAQGSPIGLHISFNAWTDSARISVERQEAERVLGVPINACRQHWLRFSWIRSWKAQQASGLTLDATLGFNDRSAFRNGAALSFYPWDFESQSPMNLQSMPLVLMDSHLYDYVDLNDVERDAEITYWLEEIRAVNGAATLLWHPHVLTPDYGWKQGFEALLTHFNAHKVVI